MKKRTCWVHPIMAMLFQRKEPGHERSPTTQQLPARQLLDAFYSKPPVQILDGTAGLWCVNAGHGRREIAEAVGRQLSTMDYAPSFQMGHPIAFEFAERLAEIAPGGPSAGLDRVFFTGSGSESVDTALKIAIAYQRVIGQGTRTRLIGRERGYHGVGFGGISVGGIVKNRQFFGSLLAGGEHPPPTHNPEQQAFS